MDYFTRLLQPRPEAAGRLRASLPPRFAAAQPAAEGVVEHRQDLTPGMPGMQDLTPIPPIPDATAPPPSIAPGPASISLSPTRTRLDIQTQTQAHMQAPARAERPERAVRVSMPDAVPRPGAQASAGVVQDLTPAPAARPLTGPPARPPAAPPLAPERLPLLQPHAAAAPPAPVVHVHIDRIEVRAPAAAPRSTPARTARPAPAVSLSDYLRGGAAR